MANSNKFPFPVLAASVKADKAATSNKQAFASNVGGGATYVG